MAIDKKQAIFSVKGYPVMSGPVEEFRNSHVHMSLSVSIAHGWVEVKV